MPDQLTNELTNQRTTAPSADFAFNFFPVHLSLLSVGENMMPLGYWMLISGWNTHAVSLARLGSACALMR